MLEEPPSRKYIPVLVAPPEPVRHATAAPVVEAKRSAPEPTAASGRSISEPQENAAGQPGDGPGAAATGHDAPVASGGKGLTVFFTIPAQGGSVVYVIDHSASMGLNRALAAAQRELAFSLERLPSQARFQVILYNRTAEPICIGRHSGLLPATEENKSQAIRYLSSVRPEGGTDHATALRKALALQPDVIYFLTDADDLKDQQVRAMTMLNRGRTTIHTIALSRATRIDADGPLHALARDNRGVAIVRCP
jgi:hypothetical protein